MPFKNGKLSAELTDSYQCVLRFFQSTCLKYWACHEKVMPGRTKCCVCHAKSSQQTWRSDAPKCNPSQEISALTSEQLRWKCFLYCACHGKCILADPLQMSHACHRSWQCHKTLRFCSLLRRCTIPCACHAKRALNVQKWSVRGVFCTCWLRNVLRATTACTFSTSQLPKVVRSWCVVLYILTSKCASRHNCVQLFISHLARWLRTRRFREPTFRPSGATNHWKNTVFRDFPTFSRICIFFLLTPSLLWSALFYSSLLSASSHLCFSSVHIVGSLTSKLLSVIVLKK